jgi:hypothetical protein
MLRFVAVPSRASCPLLHLNDNGLEDAVFYEKVAEYLGPWKRNGVDSLSFKSRGSKTDLIKLQKLYKEEGPTSSSSVSQPTSDSQGLCVVRNKHWRGKKLTMAI